LKPKDLLFQLSHLESRLNDFSYEKLNTEEAEHLKKSFQSFKRNLLEKISPSNAKSHIGHTGTSQILKRTLQSFEKSANMLDGAIADLNIDTYDAIIEHYKSYGAVLKSLKIESAMKKGNRSTLIFNKSTSSLIDSSETVDLKPILKECMGEIDLLTELVQLYEQNALEFIGATKIHLQTVDFKQIGLAAHKIKAGLAMMKTKGLHSIILQIEHVCNKDKDIKHLRFLCDCFAVEFPIVRRGLHDALTDLRENKG